MIDTLTQPTARLDLSRAVTLLDPRVERRKRRWTQATDEEPDSRENSAAQRPAAELSAWPFDEAHPLHNGARPERASPDAAPLRAPAPPPAAQPGAARAADPAETAPGAESRQPDPPDPKTRPAPGRPPGWPRDKEPHAEKAAPAPRAASPPANMPSDGPAAGPKAEPAPPERQKPSNLRLAGFPEARVEQPIGTPGDAARAAEGFPQEAPGADAVRDPDRAAGRASAPLHDAPAAPAGAVTTAVRILSKPRPRYPEEALRLGVEGDILLDVEFRYSGSVEILGVRRGLGHGLNESAIEAARKIHFAPARRDGRAVDMQATLRIRFQLLQ